jgi:hypothetical protein
MSGPRAPYRLRHEPQSTPLKFEEPLNVFGGTTARRNTNLSSFFKPRGGSEVVRVACVARLSGHPVSS